MTDNSGHKNSCWSWKIKPKDSNDSKPFIVERGIEMNLYSVQ